MSGSYSIWLQPKGPLAERLFRHITSLAQRYSSPVFAPHVTLVGGVSAESDQAMVASTERLAAQLKGYHLTFARVSCKDTFYQCVFLLCDTAAPVMQAGSQAKAHFDMTLEEYMPHLSLLYSDIDKRARESLVEELQASLCAEDDCLAGQGFDVTSLHVWRTPAGATEAWEHVKEIPLV